MWRSDVEVSRKILLLNYNEEGDIIEIQEFQDDVLKYLYFINGDIFCSHFVDEETTLIKRAKNLKLIIAEIGGRKIVQAVNKFGNEVKYDGIIELSETFSQSFSISQDLIKTFSYLST